jgi:hypothetical protein
LAAEKKRLRIVCCWGCVADDLLLYDKQGSQHFHFHKFFKVKVEVEVFESENASGSEWKFLKLFTSNSTLTSSGCILKRKLAFKAAYYFFDY